MNDHKRKAVGWWLIAGVMMIIVQTLLGGVTRLTGSGLSITEWKPIMGSLPPMSTTEWDKAFAGYKQIAQYKYVNNHFSLADFQFIFFWEWLHRLWARLLGVVFGIGFVYFLVRQYFDKGMIRPMIILFVLGGIQGLIGWVMVQSGLNDTNLYVDHLKLAVHFISAMILASYTLWFALKLMVSENKIIPDRRFSRLTIAITALLFLQLTYGAFMAGLKAAPAAATWPTINGMWIPDGMMQHSFISNPVNVHFIHRGLAYLLVILLILWYRRSQSIINNHNYSLLKHTRVYTLVLVCLQILLGIFTIFNATHITAGKFGVFETLAEMHQMVAMFLLMSLITNIYAVQKK